MAIDLKVNGAQTDFPFFIFSLTNMNVAANLATFPLLQSGP